MSGIRKYYLYECATYIFFDRGGSENLKSRQKCWNFGRFLALFTHFFSFLYITLNIFHIFTSFSHWNNYKWCGIQKCNHHCQYYTNLCIECGKNDQNCPFLVIFLSKLAYLPHIQWHTQKNCVMIFIFIVMESLEQHLRIILVLYLSP